MALRHRPGGGGASAGRWSAWGGLRVVEEVAGEAGDGEAGDRFAAGGEGVAGLLLGPDAGAVGVAEAGLERVLFGA